MKLYIAAIGLVAATSLAGCTYINAVEDTCMATRWS